MGYYRDSYCRILNFAQFELICINFAFDIFLNIEYLLKETVESKKGLQDFEYLSIK